MKQCDSFDVRAIIDGVDHQIPSDRVLLNSGDRFLGKTVDPEMVLISGTRSRRASGSGSPAKKMSPWKSIVRSPQRILSFSSSESSSETTARREALSCKDLAADAPLEEVDALRVLSRDEVSYIGAKGLQGSTHISHDRRIIPRTQFQMLAVPGLVDDFYMSPLDWNSLNQIVISLSSGIFMWDANTTQTKVLTSTEEATEDPVYSLAWRKGLCREHLAEGLHSGGVRIRDTAVNKVIFSTVNGVPFHDKRVGTCAWNPRGTCLATGSKDNKIAIYDVRSSESPVYACGHSQEVCGVRWDPEGVLFASGGNDNYLMLWDFRALSRPLAKFNDHKAAVKAIAWSPHRRGRLVSGGGTADRTLRFWDANTLSCIGETETGSQVCNVAWSANIDEIVTTHGFSQNHIVIWDTSPSTATTVPIMRPAIPIATLRGHKSRVLHLAVSPDGRTIATAAGDETLRFWKAFPGPNSTTLSIPMGFSTSCVPSGKRMGHAVKQQVTDEEVSATLIPECSMTFR